MWETIFFIGAVILGAAIAFGLYRSSTKRARNREITEAATKALYTDPERYEAKTKHELEDKVLPEA